VKAASLLFIVLIVGIFLATGTPANAHHSFAGSYIMDQTATVEGTIVQLDIRNPHSFVTLEIKDADGKSIRWGVEWGGITLLTQTGVTRQTLKVGDKVTVTGAPPRDAAMHIVLMKIIRRPADGWVWGERPEELIKGYTFPTTAPR
jgi:hypothetical protein